MNSSDQAVRRWQWYASKTAKFVGIDASFYSSTMLNRTSIPFPDWACKSPNGGVHVDAKRRRIDVIISSRPNSTDDYSWTDIYCISLISDRWLKRIADVIDEGKVGIGTVYLGGKPLEGWSTLHELNAPSLLSTEGYSMTCPLCGNTYTVLHGREYFADPIVIGRPFIVNNNGLFVREDIAISRDLPTPRGTYEPQVVEFEPH